jgi:hypothetical protein
MSIASNVAGDTRLHLILVGNVHGDADAMTAP